VERFQRMKLKCDEPLLSFCIQINLRRYATAERTFGVTAACTRVASRTLFYSEAGPTARLGCGTNTGLATRVQPLSSRVQVPTISVIKSSRPCSEASEAEGIREWTEECTPACDGMRSAPQCESADLGHRMRHALDHALTRGGPGGGACSKAIVIATVGRCKLTPV